jgi:hypothetical protein
VLNPNELVLLVAKQSRIKPGGCYKTPNIVNDTDRWWMIISDPYIMGLENIMNVPQDIITSAKLEKNLFIYN